MKFSLGHAAYLYSNVFDEYNEIEIPVPILPLTVDVAKGHDVKDLGNLHITLYNRKGMSALQTCSSAPAVLLQGYRDDLIASTSF